MANQSKHQNKDDSYEEHTDPFMQTVSRDESDDSEEVSEISPEKGRTDDRKGKGKAVMKEYSSDDSYEEHTDPLQESVSGDESDDSEEVLETSPAKERLDYKGKGKAVMKEDSSDDSEEVLEFNLEKERIGYKGKGKAAMKKDSDSDMLEGSRFEAEEVYLDDFSDKEIAWASNILDFKNQEGRPMWKLWDEQFTDWYDRFERGTKAVSSLSGCTETMDPSPEIKIELRDYQKEWLQWAVKQEESKFKGGILADEIGMGKTVEAISLVVTRRSLGPSEVRSTLVICPEECLTQWESEIAKCTVEDSIRVLVYHRTNETRHSKEFSEYDFVLTTYNTVMDEFRKQQEPVEKDAPNIFSVRWKRVILDEAHYLKSTSTKTAMYISFLKSEYRWVLTAQIDGEGLYAMIHFLQVHPYSFFLCEYCHGQFLYKNSDACCGTKCNHGKKRRFSWWNKNVDNAIRLPHNDDLGQKARAMLKHKILKDILLRRKRRKDGTLPSKFVIKNTFYDLNSDEQQSYKKVAEANQANTFVDLTKLQKEVDHPCLLNEENVISENIKTSTKIEALRVEIFDMIQKNGSAQGVVFSQFPEFLDLIRYSLDKSGITYVQLLANMTEEEKAEAVEDFTNKIVEEPKDFKRILLVSIKAGVRPSALDLTAASYVFLMEPCWNPFTELQAHELVHRIGQFQPVRVVRFITLDTIEEIIVASQEKRLAAIDWLTDDDEGHASEVDAAAVRLLFDRRGTL